MRPDLTSYVDRRISAFVDGYHWALLLKPLAALVFFGLVLLPARLAVIRWMPEGKLKRLLLRRVD